MSTLRFATYLAGQSVDPRARVRLYASASAALAAIAMAGALTWTADKLGIKPVPPPSLDYAVFFEVGDTPPPPPAPPPAPSAESSDETEDDEVEPDRSRDEVDVDLDVAPVERPSKSAHGRGVPDGVPHGTGTTPSTCIVPPCIGTNPVGTGWTPPKPRTPEPEDERVVSPIGSVKANAVYAPDPDTKKLAATKAGTFDKRGGTSSVSFCVDATGKVVDVRTKTKFSGDPEVDRICRETVAAWRFRPFTIGGKAKKTCSTVAFAIEFD